MATVSVKMTLSQHKTTMCRMKKKKPNFRKEFQSTTWKLFSKMNWTLPIFTTGVLRDFKILTKKKCPSHIDYLMTKFQQSLIKGRFQLMKNAGVWVQTTDLWIVRLHRNVNKQLLQMMQEALATIDKNNKLNILKNLVTLLVFVSKTTR